MKRHSEAVARNSVPISQVLSRELPAEGLVLEIASGTGEHAVFFALRFPRLCWQPSDADAEAQSSISAWRKEGEADNLRAPISIDAHFDEWPVGHADAVLCINMVHISPWAATEGLLKGASRVLPDNGPLILYGPYIETGVETAASNLAFDASLRSRNPAWGLRELSAVDALAAKYSLTRTALHRLPANNIMPVYRLNAGRNVQRVA